MRSTMTVVAASIFFAITPGLGKPIAPDHPIVGTWKITLPLSDGPCDEIYSIHPDGTALVTSAEEISESAYEISDDPSEKGSYRWVDTITKDNCKKDCLGQTMQVGHVATLLFSLSSSHPSPVSYQCTCHDQSGKSRYRQPNLVEQHIKKYEADTILLGECGNGLHGDLYTMLWIEMPSRRTSRRV